MYWWGYAIRKTMYAIYCFHSQLMYVLYTSATFLVQTHLGFGTIPSDWDHAQQRTQWTSVLAHGGGVRQSLFVMLHVMDRTVAGEVPYFTNDVSESHSANGQPVKIVGKQSFEIFWNWLSDGKVLVCFLDTVCWSTWWVLPVTYHIFTPSYYQHVSMTSHFRNDQQRLKCISKDCTCDAESDKLFAQLPPEVQAYDPKS